MPDDYVFCSFSIPRSEVGEMIGFLLRELKEARSRCRYLEGVRLEQALQLQKREEEAKNEAHNG